MGMERGKDGKSCSMLLKQLQLFVLWILLGSWRGKSAPCVDTPSKAMLK